ncbi:MAG: extensin family protein [Myxococcota bacterium]
MSSAMSSYTRALVSMLSLVPLAFAACDDGGSDRAAFSVQHRNDVAQSGDGSALDAADGSDATEVAPPDDTLATTTTPDTSVAPDTTTVTDSSVTPDTTVATDTTTSPDTTVTDPGPVDINVGFIGGACDAPADCDYASGECLTAGDGWPGGMCSQACTKFCPDQAGAVTTFCIDGQDYGEAGGICAQQCDFGASSTGCRQGYHCVSETRFNDPTTLRYVCVPGTGEPTDVSACVKELIAKGIGFTLASNPMDVIPGGNGEVCDVMDPIYLDPTVDGVTFHPVTGSGIDTTDFDSAPTRLFVTCPVALAIYDTVQLLHERHITDVVHYGTYNCRYIAGTTTLSEHARANAIDLVGFETDTGDRWTVLDDWDLCDTTPEAAGGEFLYWLGQQMYAEWIWNIILDPEYNADHANHFHVDLTEGSHFLAECQ